MKFKFITVLAILCIINYAKARNYYFSSNSGNDSRSSTEAQNPSTPWKSVSKLNSFFGSLQPGDSVFFKRGETFSGTIKISRSGTLESPIVIAAYGKGDQPVITSLVELTNWTSAGNGVWESYNNKLGSAVNIVLINKTMQEMGRFPNSNAENKGYLTIDTANSNISVTDKELTASTDWTGAEVVIRRNRWTIDRNVIKSHTGSTLHYASVTSNVAKKGFGYFIQNHIKTLDQVGEWYYDPATKNMSVYFGTASPSLYTVEVPTKGNIVYSLDCSHIILKDLTLKGGNTDSFKAKGGSNITIKNCNILYSGRNGVKLTKHANFKIENSNILHSNSTGLNLAASNSNPIIRCSKIENTGLLPGMGEKDGTLSIGIQCYSEGAIIEYNEVQNSGYNGIAIKLRSVKVRNNFINNYCLTKDDGGGIYSANGSNKTFSDAEITGNIILNGIGAPQGTNGFASNAEGIYMDDNSNGVEIIGNTVANCNRGIYLHNARSISVKDNNFFNNNVQFYAKHDKTGGPISNLTVQGNIMFSKLPTQLVSHIETRLNDIASMGSFNDNYYTRPLDDGIVFYNSYKNDAGTKVKEFLDLGNWKLRYGKDINSKGAPMHIFPYTIKGLIGSNKFAHGTFDTSTSKSKVFGNKCKISWANEGALDNGYLSVSPAEAGSSITISVGELDKKKNYILKYSATSERDMTIGAFLRYGGSPYQPISPVTYRKITPARNDIEILFTPSVSQSSGTLVFTADQASNYCIDNIQVYEANVTITNPDNFILFEYNPTQSSKTITLKGKYRDVKNKLYDNKVVLPPYSSLVLIKESANVVKRSTGLTKSLPFDMKGVLKDDKVYFEPDVKEKNHSD